MSAGYAVRKVCSCGRLRKALTEIIAHAGHPNASEGCRIIIQKAMQALAETETPPLKPVGFMKIDGKVLPYY